MEHSVFLSQILGCAVAALFVLLIWEHHRLRAIEKRLERMQRPWNEKKVREHRLHGGSDYPTWTISGSGTGKRR